MALKITKRERPDSQGVWVNIAQDADGYMWWTDTDREDGVVDRESEARLKVAPGRNPRARQLSRTLGRRYERFRRGNRLPPEIEDKMLREVLARALLEDWEGIEVGGSNGAYTPEAGLRAMEADPEFEDLVTTIANALAQDRVEAIAEDSETLGNASSGGSSSRASQESGPNDGSTGG